MDLLTITDTAVESLLGAMHASGLDGYAARLRIVGRALEGFQYDFRTVPLSDCSDDDTVLNVGELLLYLDADTIPHLTGTIIDTKPEGGLKIENPNPVFSSEIAREVAHVIEKQINPGVGIHGGRIMLVDVRNEIAFITMEGGCKGCGMARATLKLGVDKMIREAVPAIREIVDTTEHAKGINPYYLPDAVGQSPLAEPE
jgi:Fe/S biogenesis protein NfuA